MLKNQTIKLLCFSKTRKWQKSNQQVTEASACLRCAMPASAWQVGVAQLSSAIAIGSLEVSPRKHRSILNFDNFLFTKMSGLTCKEKTWIVVIDMCIEPEDVQWRRSTNVSNQSGNQRGLKVLQLVNITTLGDYESSFISMKSCLKACSQN